LFVKNANLLYLSFRRIYRQGQQRPTSIYRLFTSGTIEEVMYQRQTSKNTISGGVLDKKAGLAFSRDEINECMALKAGCDCDTRRKAMGKGWPPYAGLNSLLDQGVEDTPLADVATTLGDVVGFVRVVPDGASDEGMAVEVLGGTGSGSTNVDLDAYNSDSEEEFEFAAKPNACNKLDSDASAHDEECGSDASNSEAEFE
jgi:DNA repair and recombination protein RAD54 and RAD54-like protein